MTSSLRGLVAGTLRVELLTEGCHSGCDISLCVPFLSLTLSRSYSGLVADTFRILRRTLDRLEDPDTGSTPVVVG